MLEIGEMRKVVVVVVDGGGVEGCNKRYGAKCLLLDFAENTSEEASYASLYGARVENYDL